MDTTIFLAQLIGPAVLAVGLGIFFSRSYYNKVYRGLQNETLAVLMGGLTVLIAGIVIVLTHNVWDSLLAGIISLIGWLSILKGLMLIILPRWVDKIGDSVADSKWFPTAAVIYTLVGAYISYAAYLI